MQPTPESRIQSHRTGASITPASAVVQTTPEGTLTTRHRGTDLDLTNGIPTLADVASDVGGSGATASTDAPDDTEQQYDTQ